jgi:hypothetical protein
MGRSSRFLRGAVLLFPPVLLFPQILLFPQAVLGQTQSATGDVNRQIADLTALVQKLQSRVEELEMRLKPPIERSAEQPTPVAPNEAQSAMKEAQPATKEAQLANKELQAAGLREAGPVEGALPAADQTAPPTLSNFLSGTSVNFLFDGYYGYNFNNPIGRTNLLRAYDVSSNAFSLNQADVVVENAPDPANGKRWGLRLDLQFGQATATLQGNPANEPRPEIYRNIFQAYGTYVIPVGRGLTVDFGKFSSSLGFENNYTQDQINYSRSFWFDFLPFYHMGVRMNYQLNSVVGLNYWVVNGTQQVEPFNGFKDQYFGLALQPRKNVSWNVNYYLGQEHPDVVYLPGSTLPLPEQQGTPFEPIVNAPKGKLNIFDSYASWQASSKLTFALEGDYVIERLFTSSAPARVEGGAGYARYQLTPRFAIAGRAEYLTDHGGLYTGVSQSLREATITFEERLAAGVVLRQEWRGDFSNHPFFLTDALGILKRQQNTATMGVVWWFGPKNSPW